MGSRASHGPWHTSSQASIVIWRPQRMGGGLTAEISLEAREKTDRTKDTRGLAWWWMQGHWLSLCQTSPRLARHCHLPAIGNGHKKFTRRGRMLWALPQWLWPSFQFHPTHSHLIHWPLAAVFAKKTLNQIPFTHSLQNIFALPNRPGSVVQIWAPVFKYLHYRFPQFNSPWVQARVESFQLKVMLVWSSFTMLMFL